MAVAQILKLLKVCVFQPLETCIGFEQFSFCELHLLCNNYPSSILNILPCQMRTQNQHLKHMHKLS